MKNTPHDIHNLEPHQVFVFGSNTNGIHGKGAARTAEQLFGARRGVGEGMTGQCYAIPTRKYRMGGFQTLELDVISIFVKKFLEHAKLHPDTEFLVTLIGCGYAGYQPEQIKPMFRKAPANVILPVEFR